ncbi:MAG: hypothetical protein NT021_01770 [Sphingobacteriales bacterium]|nr:hypothetical protein [Sphingobacteriales bacterium]
MKVEGTILHLKKQECHAEPVEAANNLRQAQGDKRQAITKPRPGRTAGQRKGLSAEASFCIEYFQPFLIKQKGKTNTLKIFLNNKAFPRMEERLC